MVPADLFSPTGELVSKKLIMLTGKGGIGKSTIAAAIGDLVAETGRRVLIVQNAALDQISPLFGHEPSFDQLLTVRPNLEVLNIDQVANFRDYIVEYLGYKRLYNTVFSNQVVRSLINAIPGWADVMLLGRLYFQCEIRGQHDLIIFDGPASGHFLNLMTTPDSVLAMGLGGPLMKETQRVKDFISDRSKCAMLYIGVPEELVVSECLDFLPRLIKMAPTQLAGILVNRSPIPNASPLQGSPAEVYAARHTEAAKEAFSLLRQGMLESDREIHRLPIQTIADRGFISEPLPAGFGRLFLDPTASPLTWDHPH